MAGSEKSMEEVIRRDGRYPLEAYSFLHEGLSRAIKTVHGEDREDLPPGPRHVTGQQLCLALRDVALDRWGMLARTVLERWNIRGTIDFGNMVYLLVQNNFMKKTEEDSLEDFRDVFRFEDGFKVKHEFELKE